MTGSVLFDAGGAGSGGGGTYVLAVARELARGGTRGLDWTFLAGSELASPLAEAPVAVASLPSGSAARRIAWEQLALARPRSDSLIAAASFGPLARPGSFVLVAHNALHYARPRIVGRAGLRLGIESALARASARRAHTVLAPTRAMADLVERVRRAPVLTSPFGAGLAERSASPRDDRFVFLHRTGWGPHKELLTLLRAVSLLAARLPGRFVVRSACDPRTAFAHGFASSAAERAMLREPLVAAHLELAAYGSTSEEQRTLEGHAVVVPSGWESFCFPLAEALRFDLPIVAADRPYARELCGEAAFYAPRGDPGRLADAMELLVRGQRPPAPDPGSVARLDWARHVDALAHAARGRPRASSPPATGC